jgi:hypothetical protein
VPSGFRAQGLEFNWYLAVFIVEVIYQ